LHLILLNYWPGQKSKCLMKLKYLRRINCECLRLWPARCGVACPLQCSHCGDSGALQRIRPEPHPSHSLFSAGT
jgi:hypothetical protein